MCLTSTTCARILRGVCRPLNISWPGSPSLRGMWAKLTQIPQIVVLTASEGGESKKKCQNIKWKKSKLQNNINSWTLPWANSINSPQCFKTFFCLMCFPLWEWKSKWSMRKSCGLVWLEADHKNNVSSFLASSFCPQLKPFILLCLAPHQSEA